VSDSDKYTLDFRKIKEEYNEPYKLEKLEYALGSCDGSSLGPDGIHCQMLKELSLHAKKELLKGYNQVWDGSAFPEEWTEALVVPVLKPGKDKSCVISYRPIALTSCVCELFEKKWKTTD
jgi:hypothetical protein